MLDVPCEEQLASQVCLIFTVIPSVHARTAAKIAYDKNMLTLSGLRSSILHFIAHKNFAPCLEDESFCPGCRDFLRAFHACYEWLDRNRHLDGSRVHKDATAQEKKEIHDFVSYVRAAADSTLRDVDLLSSEHGGEHGGRDDQMVYSKGTRRLPTSTSYVHSYRYT